MKPLTSHDRGTKEGAFRSPRKLGTLLLVFALLTGFFFGQMGPSTAHAQPSGDIEISMTGPATANIGDTITYNITVKAVNQTFLTTDVADTLPYGLTLVSATQTSGTGVTFVCTPTANTINCFTLTLVQDVSVNIAIVATVNNNALPGYYLFNQAEVSSIMPTVIDNYSEEIETHIPTNTNITVNGPSRILPGSNVTYKLVVKNNGAYPVGMVKVYNPIPSNLTYLSADLENCTLQQDNNIQVINQGEPEPAGIYCEIDGLGAGESKVISLTFLAGGTLGQCFDEMAAITIHAIPTFKITNQGMRAGDTATATFTTCYGDNNTPEPPADLVAQLRVSPDRVVTDSENTDVAYTLTVKNIGYGKAHQVQVRFPFDPSLVIGYATFDQPGAWVSEIGTDPANPYVVINFPDLDLNAAATATVVLRPAAGASSDTTEFNRFTVKWDDAVGSGKTAGSNAVRLSLGSESVNLNNGDVQLFDPAEVTLAQDQTQTFTGDFFAPGELVTAWYTDANGQSTSLGTKLADATGTVSFDFSASGHAAGEQFVLAAYGNRSGISGNSVITIGS